MSSNEARVAGSPNRQYQDAGFPVEGMESRQLNHGEIDLFGLLCFSFIAQFNCPVKL